MKGAKRAKGKDVLNNNIMVAKLVAEVVKSFARSDGYG